MNRHLNNKSFRIKAYKGQLPLYPKLPAVIVSPFLASASRAIISSFCLSLFGLSLSGAASPGQPPFGLSLSFALPLLRFSPGPTEEATEPLSRVTQTLGGSRAVVAVPYSLRCPPPPPLLLRFVAAVSGRARSATWTEMAKTRRGQAEKERRRKGEGDDTDGGR